MLRINPCKMPVGYDKEMLEKKIRKLLHCKKEDIISYEIIKESLDARKKPNLLYSLIVDVVVRDEMKYLKNNKRKDVSVTEKKQFRFGYSCEKTMKQPVIVIGAGPAGLVCAYYLAKHGYAVLLLERGKSVTERKKDVDAFWSGEKLNLQSNVQFGEGGAGTFSDGKLNTLIKDKDGRCREILSLFVQMGAPEDILYKQKPHVGTDLLVGMVTNLRKGIEENGGIVRFESQVTDFIIENGQIKGVIVNDTEKIMSTSVVLCVGHSARDTFAVLHQKGVPMEAKAFAVGLRVQHAQKLIDESQYGLQTEKVYEMLGSASYKLTANTKSGRGIYSFCMCPGGYVVNASSEEKQICINGMSYRDRASGVANSAIIIAVTPDDYGAEGPLAGVVFQRRLEQKAYELGKGKIPVQSYGAFCRNEVDAETSPVLDSKIRIKGAYQYANVRALFPEEMNEAFMEGMTSFGHKIKGFDADDTMVAGVEARTSSPVRICRDEKGQSQYKGLYPCGEGAGYAGGITSAAMDGLYIAQCVARDLKES